MLALLFGLLLSATRTHAVGDTVYVLTFQGAVTPVLEQYLANGIEAALSSNAEAIILQLDTPGGSVNVTKSITQEMLASPVPIVVYVSPAGANAGSAGTFVTLAGHAAAMASGTSIGAASPVDASGGDVGETMQAKIENILSADVENLSTRRGPEATEWAIAAVREAKAATAEQALDLGVIDFIADDVPNLLDQLDGFEVVVQDQPRTLETGEAVPVPLEMSGWQLFLSLIADPTVASLLLSLGILGLITEIRTPGFGIPGIVGIISLMLAFYALGLLDANFAGLALIAVAVALFIAEAFTPTFGLLATGGIVAFVMGAMMLFNTPGVETPWTTIITLGVGMGIFTIWIGAKALAAQRKPPYSGDEALIGRRATARRSFTSDEIGSVFVLGEWWNAELEQADKDEDKAEGSTTASRVQKGEEVEIVGRQGYTLLIKPIDE
jgi:membrane-bound serine protease (ClpP class)